MSHKTYSNSKKQLTSQRILGIQLHNVNAKDIHSYIKETINREAKAVILNLNIHGCNLAVSDPQLKEIYNQAHLVFCDGDGVRWGARILGLTVPPKVTYDRWMWQLGSFCIENDYSLFFLGGEPGISEKAALRMKEKFPELRIVGTHHGYFEKDGVENSQVIKNINRLKPDILIVGFGMPLQEKWLENNWEAINSHIFLTAGAAFDYVSGKARRTPQWLIEANLEWLFRFLQEPKRLFRRYMIGNPLFFYRILTDKFTKR